MRTLVLVILLFISTFGSAQEVLSTYEFNLGYCQVDSEPQGYGPDGWGGASFLKGKTVVTKSNFVYETQIGLAFPSVITGKVGAGYYFENLNTMFLVGLRPIPSHGYLQMQWVPKEKNYAITISYEVSAYSQVRVDNWSYSTYRWSNPSRYSLISRSYVSSFNSLRILTLGYKWNIGSKFGRY